MSSYIQIFNLTPLVSFKPIDELIYDIRYYIQEQNISSILNNMNKDEFAYKVLDIMKVYYKLVGVNSHKLGILPRVTQAMINYFQEQYNLSSIEMDILSISGLHSIKIRYKYTDSVIKKIIKLAKRDISILDDADKIFFKGGALHDLIGMQFVCSSPYEREWIARALYSFFYYDNRTDDHLVYGFYTVKRESGYKGLHCDHTSFDPRFDDRFDIQTEVSLDSYHPDMSDIEVLQNYAGLFNVELQIHTAFENLWSSMEHRYSYNIQAKGVGRDEKIRAQWNLLSTSLQSLEMQFEKLQIETEEAQYKRDYINGYEFAKRLLYKLDKNVYDEYIKNISLSQKLEELLSSHEISRQEYVQKSYFLADDISKFAKEIDNSTVSFVFKLQSAYIYYSLANHKDYFNTIDISSFVKNTLKIYRTLHQELVEDDSLQYKNLLQTALNLRYLQLAQKYGLGLIHTGNGVMNKEESEVLSYQINLEFFVEVLELLTTLDEDSLDELKQDDTAFIKIVHRSDIFAREWEIFANETPKEQEYISSLITKFRARYINTDLLEHFNHLLEHNKIKNVGYIVQFYTTLVWHGIIKPKDALKAIIRYSAFSKITQSDMFFYELSAYKYLVIDNHQQSSPYTLKHIKDFHIKNMIRQLFKIYKEESRYEYLKAKYRFEHLCNIEFKLDHFSDIL